MRIVPEGLSTFFFASSGSEVVDNAVKLARAATKRPNIICFEVGPARNVRRHSKLCRLADVLSVCRRQTMPDISITTIEMYVLVSISVSVKTYAVQTQALSPNHVSTHPWSPPPGLNPL